MDVSLDPILMLCGNAGLFGDRAGALTLLERLRLFARAGTRLLIDSVDPYATDDRRFLAYQPLAPIRLPGA